MSVSTYVCEGGALTDSQTAAVVGGVRGRTKRCDEGGGEKGNQRTKKEGQ